MPYRHYHDYSFHTHHQRPRGGRHYRAVRLRQLPWRIGFILVLVVAAVWVALEMGVRDRLETALTAAGQSATDESRREGLGREPEAEAKQTGHEVAGRVHRPGDCAAGDANCHPAAGTNPDVPGHSRGAQSGPCSNISSDYPRSRGVPFCNGWARPPRSHPASAILRRRITCWR